MLGSWFCVDGSYDQRGAVAIRFSSGEKENGKQRINMKSNLWLAKQVYTM
jgi:hypothetical protein